MSPLIFSQQIVKLVLMTGITEHVKQVSRWLDENVMSYPTPRAVTLSDFEVDWGEMCGWFCLTMDGRRVPDRFRLSLAQNGWMQFHPPMFCSPLGAPASYSAVDLTDETKMVIGEALKSVFPRLKPMGLDVATGRLIGQRTPIPERIFLLEGFVEARRVLSKVGYSLKIELAEGD